MLLTLLALCIGSATCGTTVEINQGQLLGAANVGLDNVPYVSYMGMPYAKQPVGDLRFRPPESPECWEGIRNATIERASCIQNNRGPNTFKKPTEPEQEACLYINVHTPANSSDDNLPVLLWIHGGAYATGSGNRDLYGPDYFVSKGVIVVTFNFRLDVYGFLSLDIPEAPGNIGLRDQVAALRWTRDNIAAFGGNPDAITIGGVSSGAASAHLLSLSPMCEGLFKRVIMMSGAALDPWAVSINNTGMAFEMAAKLNYTTKNPKEIYNLLRKANSTDIYEASRALIKETGIVSFQPVVEKEFCGVESFLTAKPYDIIKSGYQQDVNYLIGYTDREGIDLYSKVVNNKNALTLYQLLNQFPVNWIPADVDTTKLTSEEIASIGDKIKTFYLGNQSASNLTIDGIIDWAGQSLMQYKALVTTRVISSATNSLMYLYNFAYDGKYNIIKTPLGLTKYKGVPHFADIGYLFKVNALPLKIEDGSTDDKVRRATVELWTNFIKYGDPTPAKTDLIPIGWVPTYGRDFTYMKIDSNLTLFDNTLAAEFAFWDEIYTELDLPIQ